MRRVSMDSMLHVGQNFTDTPKSNWFRRLSGALPAQGGDWSSWRAEGIILSAV